MWRGHIGERKKRGVSASPIAAQPKAIIATERHDVYYFVDLIA